MVTRRQGFNPEWRSDHRGPNGRGLCKWCLNEVPPRRRTWCSQECVDEFDKRTPEGFRRLVLERDGGICQHCGVDCFEIEKIITRLAIKNYDDSIEILMAKAKMRKKIRKMGFPVGRSIAEADHIVPISEGGENTEENGRTLCIFCHRIETKALADRRGEKRRGPEPWYDGNIDGRNVVVCMPDGPVFYHQKRPFILKGCLEYHDLEHEAFVIWQQYDGKKFQPPVYWGSLARWWCEQKCRTEQLRVVKKKSYYEPVWLPDVQEKLSLGEAVV